MAAYSLVVGKLASVSKNTRATMWKVFVGIAAVGALVGLVFILNDQLPSGTVIDPDPSAPPPMVVVIEAENITPPDYSSLHTGLLFRTNFAAPVVRMQASDGSIHAFSQPVVSGIELRRDQAEFRAAFGSSCLALEHLILPAPVPFLVAKVS